MKVLIPSPLRSYSSGRSWVEASGATLAEVLTDLERQFPGIRFRMIDEQERVRRHIRLFVNGAQTFDLAQPLRPSDELCIVQALSGG
jgi:sulfur-carrier protein